MSIQMMLLGTGAVATKTYVDDCFYTHVYTGDGNSSGQNITGSDFEPDLVWIKGRNHTANHILVDSARGNNKVLYSNTNDDQDTNEDYVNSRFVGGFKVGNSGITNGSNETNVGWTWKKTPGFFDVVTYTGTGSARTVAHSLGSVPGMVIIKKTNGNENWNVWHKSLPLRDGYDYTRQKLELNTGTPAANLGGNTTWNDTKPSATTITLGTNSEVNQTSNEYVAYFFAGGKSTTDKAVDFDGSDYLQIASSADLSSGTGDFTFEAWVYGNSGTSSTSQCIYDNRSGTGSNTTGFFLGRMSAHSGNIELYSAGGYRNENGDSFTEESWTHVAVVRSSGVIKLYLNGKQSGDSYTTSNNYSNTTARIGSGTGGSDKWQGQISNVRFVKGQALYTTNFNVPHDPFTTISQGAYTSNVKLICCNGSAVTSSTVTPSTITANGDPTITTNNSIFDDTAAHVFGDAEDQNVIKCGSYVGNGSADGPEINLGWEPQWLLFRNIEENGDEWVLYDSMRGLVTKGNDARLYANVTQTENSVDQVDLTSTGFKITMNHSQVNRPNDKIIFVAIRRPDGYVGKPPELGTDVFNMVAGTNSPPAFVSGFPVDFALYRQPAASHNWDTTARLMGSGSEHTYLRTNTTAAEVGAGAFKFDFMNGWLNSTGWDSSYQSWMWKRHAGFDVVNYKGNDAVRWLTHNLNAVPEMIWVKRRTPDAGNWWVYHVGANGGTNPEGKELVLNTNAAEVGTNFWAVPTSTHFYIGGSSHINDSSNTHLVCLFASVDGISKVGYYTGNGVSNPASGQTITTGFAPRFLIVKNITDSNDWFVLDTTRGWGSGSDKFLKLNSTDPHYNHDFGAPTSNGFTLPDDNGAYNAPNKQYIYYAHA